MRSEEVFEAFPESIGECVYAPVAEARRVRKGERVIINVGFNVEVRAEENGWQVEIGREYAFVTDEVFAKRFVSEKKEGTMPFPKDAKIKSVKKGEGIIVQPWSDTDLAVEATAPDDGYIVTLPEIGKPRFMSKSAFHANYKTDRVPSLAEGENRRYRFLPKEDEATVRYLVLPKDITLDFQEGSCLMEAGSVLFENREDVDGYTSVSADAFFRVYLVTKEAPAATRPGQLRMPKLEDYRAKL